MPRTPALTALVVAAVLVVAGCSDDGDAGSSTTPPAVAPTAPTDRALVEVLDAGSGDRRALALDVDADTSQEVSLVLEQELVADEAVTRVPAISFAMTSVVTAVGDDEVATEQTFGEPGLAGDRLSESDAAAVRAQLGTLTGTTSQLVVRRDGTTVRAADGVPAAAQPDSLLRLLVPVLPTGEVGVGSTWTATTVVLVDGALVDQVATYTLSSLEGDDYVVEVTAEQQYRPGDVGGTEVRSGRGTVTATLTGSLRSVVPTEASATVSSQVVYVVAGAASELRSTLALDLSAGG
ncbi:hypothetical protein ABFT23_13530 [Nocardioides sp. C4-1]|uniref:hypothetical protein n=1 Tax=Nocardioides sp. C4-1 TaxID=3151851 RepID=UPI003264FC81